MLRHKHTQAHTQGVWKPSRLVPGQGMYRGAIKAGKKGFVQARGGRLLALCAHGPARSLTRLRLQCGPVGDGEGDGRKEDSHRK